MSVTELVGNGDALHKKKNYKGALVWYERAIVADPKCDVAWYKKGNTLYNLEKYKEAKEAFKKAAKLNTKFSDAWVKTLAKKGDRLRRQKKYQNALIAFKESIKIDPKQAALWNKKAYVLFKLARYEESYEAFEKATKLSKENFNAWFRRGHILLRLTRYEEAQRSFEKAIKIKPQKVFLWNNKGFALLNLGRYKEALDAFDIAIGLNRDDFYAWHNRGDALLNLGRYKEALEAFEEAIRINPHYLLPYISLAKLFFDSGCPESASKKIEEVLENDGTYAPALLLKGRIDVENLDYDSAIRSFEKAAFSDLGDPLPLIWTAYVRYLRAESFFNRGDRLYQEEVFKTIRELEKANTLSQRGIKKEIRACILYFLGYFYYQNNDIFAAKERLVECLVLKSKSSIEEKTRELLKNIWNSKIKPNWWDWWLNSPFSRWKKRVVFVLIVSLISLLLFHVYVPYFLPFIEKELSFYVIIIGFLIFILLSPNIESIRAKEVDIKLRSPPTFELFLSPSMMGTRIKKLE